VRLYVGMSVIRVPEELRAELAFVFLFRNLAETLEREDLQALGPEAAPAPEIEPVAAGARSADEGGDAALRRRPLLALRYCAARDLVERAARILAAERPEESLDVLGVEGAADLPEVLVDRDQVADALSRLLGNAAHRAGGLGKVRVKLEETEAVGERGVRTGAFVRVDVLFPREEITEDDLHPDEDRGAPRDYHRRADLAAAEQLLQANGGRLVHPTPGPTERQLSALIPVARKGASSSP
jgi:hypothetical protein